MVKLKTGTRRSLAGVCVYVQENSDTVESLGKLRPSRQFGEVLVGHVHASPLLLSRVQRQCGAEALLLDALQQRLRVSVGSVQDQHAFPCRRRGRSLEGCALSMLGSEVRAPPGAGMTVSR